MEETQTNGNSRVTVAILGERLAQTERRVTDGLRDVGDKIDGLSSKLDKALSEQEKRVRECETWNTTSKGKWEAHATEHGRERGLIATLTSVGLIIATALGIAIPKP